MHGITTWHSITHCMNTYQRNGFHNTMWFTLFLLTGVIVLLLLLIRKQCVQLIYYNGILMPCYMPPNNSVHSINCCCMFSCWNCWRTLSLWGWTFYSIYIFFIIYVCIWLLCYYVDYCSQYIFVNSPDMFSAKFSAFEFIFTSNIQNCLLLSKWMNQMANNSYYISLRRVDILIYTPYDCINI